MDLIKDKKQQRKIFENKYSLGVVVTLFVVFFTIFSIDGICNQWI
jgi:presenilin-like A22 family membrane protease